jgi:hypothetical protein
VAAQANPPSARGEQSQKPCLPPQSWTTTLPPHAELRALQAMTHLPFSHTRSCLRHFCFFFLVHSLGFFFLAAAP